MRHILVEWHDITAGVDKLDTWASKDKILEQAKMATATTIGWLLEKTKYRLVVASSRTDDDEFSDINIIPRGCVKRMADLVEHQPKKAAQKALDSPSK